MNALFYVIGGLVIAGGILSIAAPEKIWKLKQDMARSEALATAEEPNPRSLTIIRAQGVFLIVFGVVWLVATYSFHKDWKEFEREFDDSRLNAPETRREP